MTYKTTYMQHTSKILSGMFIMVLLSACGGGAKDDKALLNDKKVQLEKLKNEQNTLSVQIDSLEKQIARLDPEGSAVKAKLVTLAPIVSDTFSHYIELQGKIDAQNVSYVAPRGQGGVVKAIYVKQGDVVKKGQLLLKLDDAILRQGVVTAQQQLSGIKAQLAQAQSVYERQQNLWKQDIGSELQVLNAKTNVEALQSQYNAAQANIQLNQEQLNTSNVYAEMSGTANIVNVRVGEFFTAGQQIQLVSAGNLKVTVNVPENYLERVQVGSPLVISIPEASKTINSKVAVSGKIIDPVTRSFYVEGNLPNTKDLRPNQIAMVRIKDYSSNNAITIPVNTLQNDDKGKFVMVAAMENGKMVARKKQVEIGELYGEKLEVKSGLSAGDQVIVDGFQGLYNGQVITTAAN